MVNTTAFMYPISLDPSLRSHVSRLEGADAVFDQATARFLLSCAQAGFLLRFAAITIDAIFTALAGGVFGVLAAIVAEAFGYSLADVPILGSVYSVLVDWSGAAVEVFLVSRCGGGVGKLVLGLRIVDEKSGHYLSLPRAFVREVVGKFISAAFLGIGFLMAFTRKDQCALHDLMVNSKVKNIRQPSEGV